MAAARRLARVEVAALPRLAERPPLALPGEIARVARAPLTVPQAAALRELAAACAEYAHAEEAHTAAAFALAADAGERAQEVAEDWLRRSKATGRHDLARGLDTPRATLYAAELARRAAGRRQYEAAAEVARTDALDALDAGAIWPTRTPDALDGAGGRDE